MNPGMPPQGILIVVEGQRDTASALPAWARAEETKDLYIHCLCCATATAATATTTTTTHADVGAASTFGVVLAT